MGGRVAIPSFDDISHTAPHCAAHSFREFVVRRLARSSALITSLLGLHAGCTCALAEPLRAQFFGVSTVQVTDGQTQLMTDGFFSRPSVLSMVTLMQPNEARIDKALAKGGISRLDALLVAHSHHDHALDVGPVARKTGALVVGTPSVGEIAQGQGLNAARTRAVEGGEVLRFGGFEVDVIRSPHSPDPLFPGEIDDPLHMPATLMQFKEGGNLSFLLRHAQGKVLIHGSANYVPGMYAGKRADVVFLGIGLLGKQSRDFIQAYWHEVVQVTGAKVVIPVHWDDFTRSLDEPLKQTIWPLDNIPAALKAINALAAADGVEVRVLQQYQRVELPISAQ